MALLCKEWETTGWRAARRKPAGKSLLPAGLRLVDLADRGKLSKLGGNVKRDRTITGNYKRDLIKRIYDKYGKTDPGLADKLKANVLKMQPDHVHELQLKGLDAVTELGLLNAQVNSTIGTTIRNQIQNLPANTRISRVRIRRIGI